jgi:lipoprotein-anchoring transpeptidase ErfK/SrfK
MKNNNEKRIGTVKKLILAMLLMVAPAVAQNNAPVLAQNTTTRTVESSASEQSKRHIVVSVADRKLALMEDDVVVKVYPVAVGAAVSPSPMGSYHIVTRLTDPTYYHTGKVIGPGPQNPLGTRWMGLSQKGYGIHGTNAPKSIGKAASHGCIRMAKADLEDLFNRVKVGEAVEIRSGAEDTTIAIFHPAVNPTTNTETVVATAMSSGADGVE